MFLASSLIGSNVGSYQLDREPHWLHNYAGDASSKEDGFLITTPSAGVTWKMVGISIMVHNAIDCLFWSVNKVQP